MIHWLQSFGSWIWGLDWSRISQFATSVGVPVLIWYTVETYRLRKEAQEQTESALMPILMLVIDPDPKLQSNAESFVWVKSIGRGPAFNITFDEVLATQAKIEFGSIPFLAVGDKVYVKMTMKELKPESTFPKGDLSILATLIGKGMFPQAIRFTLNCGDARGLRYRGEFDFTCDTVMWELAKEMNIEFRSWKKERS